MIWKIPLFKIKQNEEDINAIINVVKSGKDWATGSNILEFEKSIAKYIGTKYALTFNSGTSALHTNLLAYNFKKDDEIIVPSFTFIATANAPKFVGAKPIFADIENKTYGLNPKDVEEKITKKTKAIIPIHYGGNPCNIDKIRKLANDYNLILIEDAAESMGATLNNKKVGSFGHSAMFSFCAPKIISTGEGGAITTDSKDLYEKMKLIRSHGRAETSDYFSSSEMMNYVSLGYNFRMSNIIAGLGIAQLKHIDSNIKNRRNNAKYLIKKLSDIEKVSIPHFSKRYFCIYQMFTIQVEKEMRNELAKYLTKRGIMTKVYFEPVHLSYFYKNVLGYRNKLPITEDLSSKVLTLPMYPSLQREEMDYISDSIHSFFS